MSLLKITENRIKLCDVTLLKIKNTKKGFLFKFLGIPIYRCCQSIAQLVNEIKTNTDFDMRKFDEEISSLVKIKENFKCNLMQNKIGYLASELYEMGGHSKSLRDLSKSLQNVYKQKLFLTKLSATLKSAPYLMKNLKNYMEVYGDDFSYLKFRKQVEDFAQKIIDFAPKTLMVYIHPDDIFGTAVLACLKKTSKIKIIYFNHASHYPNLGMTFADIILEGMPTTAKITHEKRHLYNTQIIGLQSLAKEETIYYSKEELDRIKEDIGINKNNLITMSGGSSYKFFDKCGTSEYFEMILRLLQKEKNLYHVIISEFNKKQEHIINHIFSKNIELKDRLIFLPYQTTFDKYFQLADVFIDSFPVSSALTQIDLMRNKVVSLVKINNEKPEYSFHEYQMKDYPYMFENIEDLEKAVIELLHDKAKRQDIVKRNYKYWLDTYESNVVKNKYIAAIEELN